MLRRLDLETATNRNKWNTFKKATFNFRRSRTPPFIAARRDEQQLARAGE